MKLLKNILLLLLVVISSQVISAYDFEVNGLGYNLNSSNSVTLTYCQPGLSAAGLITIPATVTYDGKTYSVTSIGDYVFVDFNITGVTIPNSVTSIGYCSFADCTQLISVTIPNSVTSIGDYTFWRCTGLKSVTISNSLTSISTCMFDGCTSLYSVTIPNSVISICSSAFAGCTHLRSVTIPNSVTSIDYGAFSGCTALISVTIGDSLEEIGYQAFYNTPWDQRLPDGMNYVGLVAYKYKGDMPVNTSITINDGTKGIAAGAFKDYSALKNILIPSSVTNIGASAFESCYGLTSVTIGNSVTSIKNYAFAYCSALDSITCDAFEPPTIFNETFTSYNSHLTIPDISSYKYHAAPYWKNFNNISFDSGSGLSVYGDTIKICRGIDADFSVPIRMQNSRPITAMQCGVSSSISINDVVLSNSRNGGDHTLSYYNNKILIASPTLKTFKGNDGTLFNINLHTNSTTAGKVGEISMADILLSTTDGVGLFKPEYTIPVYMTYLVGDANGDGSVDAADYVVTCNKIALRPVTTFFEDAANVNNDSYLDVSDLVGITRIALGLDGVHMRGRMNNSQHTDVKASASKVYSHDIEIADGKTAILTINLSNAIAYKAMQMDVTLPAGLTITEAHLSDRAGSLQLMTGESEDGSTRLVASTMDDGAIAAGDGALLTLVLSADSQWSGNGTITIDDIIAATPDALRHEIEGISINATGTPSGIGTVITDDGNTLVDVYNLNGQLVKRNVKRSEAVKGLPTGYYLIGNEKVYVK